MLVSAPEKYFYKEIFPYVARKEKVSIVVSCLGQAVVAEKHGISDVDEQAQRVVNDIRVRFAFTNLDPTMVFEATNRINAKFHSKLPPESQGQALGKQNDLALRVVSLLNSET